MVPGPAQSLIDAMLFCIVLLNAFFAITNIIVYYTSEGRFNVMALAVFQILVMTMAINTLLS